MEKQMVCKDCKHFVLHYVRYGKSYHAIDYGHCVYPRLKDRTTATKACGHYRERK